MENGSVKRVEKKAAEIGEGDSVIGRYAIRQLESPREYRNKTGRYLVIRVGDKTGDVAVKYWGGPDADRTIGTHRSLAVGDVVELTGEVIMDNYDNQLTVTMQEGQNNFRLLEEGEFDPSDYLPTSTRDLELIWQEVSVALRSVEDPHLKRLLDSFLSDEEFIRIFKESPSAITHHHGYVGGLLEHTWGVMKLCDTMATVAEGLDRDLLVTAAFFHDIGKIESYTYTTSIDMSDLGRFVGHVVISDRMVRERSEGISDFPEGLRMKLSHAILSHHRSMEWGSPTQIKTPEACALHFADHMDANVKEMLEIREEGADAEGDWSWSKRIGGAVYTGD